MAISFTSGLFAKYPYSGMRLHNRNDIVNQLFCNAVHQLITNLLINQIRNQGLPKGFAAPYFKPCFIPQYAPRSAWFSGFQYSGFQFPQPDFTFVHRTSGHGTGPKPRAQENGMPRFAPEMDQPAPPTSRSEKVRSAVNGIVRIASQFDKSGKIKADIDKVNQDLQSCLNASSPTLERQAQEQLASSLNRLVRRLGLLIHPDKNPSAEAAEAFKQVSALRDSFEKERSGQAA